MSRSRSRRKTNDVILPAVVIISALFLYTSLPSVYQILVLFTIAVVMVGLTIYAIRFRSAPRRRVRRIGFLRITTVRKGILSIPRWTSITISRRSK